MESLHIFMFCIVSVAGNSGGPPVTVCTSLLPNHGGSQPAGNGGYLITTDMVANSEMTGYQYIADQNYTVTLNGTMNTFRGFAVQSVAVPGGTAAGSFTPGANQQILNCGAQNTIVHDNQAPNTMDFTTQTFTWQAPSGSNGVVDFYYTVVRVRSEYYVRRSAINNLASTSSTPMPPVSIIPNGVTTPSTSGGNYPLIFKTPSNCNQGDCTVFVGIEINSGNQDYLNFYIEGEAAAWVGVGFSTTLNMMAADVLACNFNPDTDMIEVFDTWNADSGRNNINDDEMDTFLFSGRSENGRISCSFGRSINGTGNTQDVDLDGDYYVMYGRRSAGPSAGGINSHAANENPILTGAVVSILNSTGVQAGDNFASVRNALVRAHGILMLIAWPLLASTAIYFASYMRPALPKGEWFQVHRAFMIISLFLTAAGFVLIFISQLRNPIPGLSELGTFDSVTRIRSAHFAIGILVMCLQIVNPLIAICRCKPGDKNRWIFNVIHGFPGIGFIAEVAALTNVALGLSVFSSRYSRIDNHGIVWAYLAFIGYILATQIIYYIIRQYCKYKNRNKKNDGWSVHHDGKEEVKLERVDGGGDEKKEDGDNALKHGGCEPCTTKSGGSCYGRWIGCAFYVTYSVIVILAIAIIVALPRVN